jgi:hypothetical protein
MLNDERNRLIPPDGTGMQTWDEPSGDWSDNSTKWEVLAPEAKPPLAARISQKIHDAFNPSENSNGKADLVIDASVITAMLGCLTGMLYALSTSDNPRQVDWYNQQVSPLFNQYLSGLIFTVGIFTAKKTAESLLKKEAKKNK